MQEQIDSFESLPESLHFDRGSDSNCSDMDQSIYQSNLLLNSMETPTLADFLSSPNEANMDYMIINPQGTDDLGVWNSRDHNTNSFVVNQDNHDETKIADGWNTTLSINSGGIPRLEERHSERTNLSFENDGLNLNLNNIPVEGKAFTQRLNVTNVSQIAEHNMHSNPRTNDMEVSLCPFVPEFFGSEHVPYSNSNVSSSIGVGNVPGDDSRERNSSRLLACKRKYMEGVIGESSTSHFSADLNSPSSSMHLTAASTLEEKQSPSFSRLHGVSSEWHPPSSSSRNIETLQRNLRARVNLSLQHDASSSQSHFVASSNMLSSYSSPSEPSSNLNPFINSAEQSQPHILPVPVLPHRIHQSPPSSRMANSSIPPFLQRRMGLIAAHEESSLRSLPTNGAATHPTFLARNSVSHLVQDPANWNSSNSNLTMLGNRVGSTSGITPLPVSMREPSEMVPVQYPRNLALAVQSSLVSSGGSESGHQIISLPSWHSVSSVSTQEPGQSSRSARQGHSQSYPRTTAVPSDRQHGLSALPLSARSRDRRSRMISEIRNALDLMRRGGDLRFEDFFLDQSGFYGRPNFLDRHRNMRLDVDNMSYEELLALEERIGYVSTGLCEEAILRCLKKQIYSRSNFDVAAEDLEPCCICQEDYSEGDDIGTLECRHDFHIDCIKQWLMMKNLCPICKTAALVEGHSTMAGGTK